MSATLSFAAALLLVVRKPSWANNYVPVPSNEDDFGFNILANRSIVFHLIAIDDIYQNDD